MYAELLQREPNDDVRELKGMIACRGYAKGTARIIAGPETEEGRSFQKGDILVTSMTRPNSFLL